MKKLKKIAEDGGCIDDFTEGHIRVFPSGKVKLRGINILSKDDLEDAAYQIRLKGNYMVVRGVI